LVTFYQKSPDHGTGFDTVGKGIAQSQSMVEAIKAAFDLTKDSRLFNAH
jgi:Pyridoxal phosphate biosynthesis protein